MIRARHRRLPRRRLRRVRLHPRTSARGSLHSPEVVPRADLRFASHCRRSNRRRAPETRLTLRNCNSRGGNPPGPRERRSSPRVVNKRYKTFTLALHVRWSVIDLVIQKYPVWAASSRATATPGAGRAGLTSTQRIFTHRWTTPTRCTASESRPSARERRLYPRRAQPRGRARSKRSVWATQRAWSTNRRPRLRRPMIRLANGGFKSGRAAITSCAAAACSWEYTSAASARRSRCSR